eukprot:COSAG02_NODE_158_length_32954_cov_16.416771_3_plen_701_part_00
MFASTEITVFAIQAYMVRMVKEETDADLWAALRAKHPKLLDDVPTRGRKIEWESLDDAELPVFGANRRRDGEAAVVFIPGVDVDAQRRFLEGLERQRQRAERQRRDVERRRRQVERRREEEIRRFEQELRGVEQRRRWSYCVIPSVIAIATLSVIGTTQMMMHHPPANPIKPITVPTISSSDSGSIDGSGSGSDVECAWACMALQLLPKLQISIGASLHVCSLIFKSLYRRRIAEELTFFTIFGGVPIFLPILYIDVAAASSVEVWVLLPLCGGLLSASWLLAQGYFLYDSFPNLRSNNISRKAGGLVPLTVVLYYALAGFARTVPEHAGSDVRLPPERAEYQCDWVCIAMWLLPVEFCVSVMCFVITVVYLVCKDEIGTVLQRLRNNNGTAKATAFVTAGTCVVWAVVFWPILLWWLSPDTVIAGSVFVAYSLIPTSITLAPVATWFGVFIVLNIMELDRGRVADITFGTHGVVTLAQSIVSVIAVIQVRDQPVPQLAEHFQWTWPCMALRAVGALPLAITVCALCAEVNRRENCRRLRTALPFGVLSLALACWVETPQMLVTGSSFWLYPLISASSALGAGVPAALWLHTLPNRSPNVKVCTACAVAVPAAATSGWLLWVLRCSADPEFAASLSTVARQQVMVAPGICVISCVGLLLVPVRPAASATVICQIALLFNIMCCLNNVPHSCACVSNSMPF